MYSPGINIVACLAGLYGFIRLFQALWKRNKASLPPGPRPLPVLGNLLDLPGEGDLDGPYWAKHKDLYGPISSVSVLGQTIIILNDKDVTFEILDKRSSKYSNRPRLVFIGDLCNASDAPALDQYGERFRTGRKLLHQFMGTRSSVARYEPLEEREARRLLLRILQSPKDFADHIRTLPGAIILKMTYGYTVKSHGDDPLVELADRTLQRFSMASQPGRWIVDTLPILRYLPKWFPGAGFIRTAEEFKAVFEESMTIPYTFVEEQSASGTASPSFTAAHLDKVASGELGERVLKWAAQNIYAGGSDTTVSAILTFVLAMTMNPSIFDRAQAEIDAVVGPDRLPTYEDRPNLPFTDAILKETLRWNVVAPTGIPHAASEDDVFMGYFIPKGSVIIPNIWQFMRDPETYHDPWIFKPERFLGVNGKVPELDPHTMCFGFGRRICPGKELADATLFIAIVMMTAVFDIRKAKDENGMDIDPVCEYTKGTVSHPKKFACSFTPRSPKAKRLIESVQDDHPFEAGDAEKIGKKL